MHLRTATNLLLCSLASASAGKPGEALLNSSNGAIRNVSRTECGAGAAVSLRMA